MNIMTKRGSLDNVVTYEHYCDTKADLDNIPKDQITLGTIALVLVDDDDAIGIYMADSNKQWHAISSFSGGSGSGGDSEDEEDEYMVVDFDLAEYNEEYSSYMMPAGTFDQVTAAYNAGKPVIGKITSKDDNPEQYSLYLTMVNSQYGHVFITSNWWPNQGSGSYGHKCVQLYSEDYIIAMGF